MSDLSFLWHDYETWGKDPRRDRAAQFAAIRTDSRLREIGEAVNIFCKPCDDFLPHPQAALITGITPQYAERHGLIEAEFFRRINDCFMQPGTCGVGYNTIRFDDEVTRTGFYRNFIDSYAREWQNGNSRWDILDLARMTHALRPDGIVWPTDDNGVASFRLERLTAANEIAHSGAHDALADVRATIALARLIREKQPRLFDYYLGLRHKVAAARMLDINRKRIVLHVSGMYPASLGCISPVVPLLAHPVNSNEIIAYDLRKDPAPLLAMSVDEITENLYTRTADLPEGVERIGLKGIHVNKSPALAPVATLDAAQVEKWQVDLQQAEQHRQQLLADESLIQRLLQVYQPGKFHAGADRDAESSLYDGFINRADRELCNLVLKKKPEQLIEWRPEFADQRLNVIYPRYLARNWPGLLSPQQLQKWQGYCQARLLDGEFDSTLTLAEYQASLEELAHQELSAGQQEILRKLAEWIER